MPILNVEIVLADNETVRDGLASRIADAAGDVFQSPAGSTWVRLRTLPQSCYAENGGGPPDGVLPVFVTVLKARTPEGAALREEVRQLNEHIAEICGRPGDNVHIRYSPDAAGRIAFGGILRE